MSHANTLPSPQHRENTLSVRDLCLTAMFTALIAAFSWISVPAPPPFVPFTLQTFGVFIALEMLGGKRATLSVLCFVLLAALGAPVLSGFKGGLGALFGTTGGYILGFLLMSLLYWLLEVLLGKAVWVRILALAGGLLLCYTFGTIWFIVLYTRQQEAISIGTALMWCVVPFILPDVVKLSLAFCMGAAIKKRIRI